MATEKNTQSFWEHLDVLRTAIMKIAAVAVVFGIAAFFFKEQLFDVGACTERRQIHNLSTA